MIFILQNAINIFYNLYYDYWDLITKFWPNSAKLNTPFISNYLINCNRTLSRRATVWAWSWYSGPGNIPSSRYYWNRFLNIKEIIEKWIYKFRGLNWVNFFEPSKKEKYTCRKLGLNKSTFWLLKFTLWVLNLTLWLPNFGRTPKDLVQIKSKWQVFCNYDK